MKDVENLFNDDFIYMVKKLIPVDHFLVAMTPDNFLAMAARFKTVKGQGSKPDDGKLENLAKVFGKVKLDTIPYLSLSPAYKSDSLLNLTLMQDTVRVSGHEGRHRMVTLKSKGYELVPVILKGKNLVLTEAPKYVVPQNRDWDKRVLWSKVFHQYPSE